MPPLKSPQKYSRSIKPIIEKMMHGQARFYPDFVCGSGVSLGKENAIGKDIFSPCWL